MLQDFGHGAQAAALLGVQRGPRRDVHDVEAVGGHHGRVHEAVVEQVPHDLGHRTAGAQQGRLLRPRTAGWEHRSPPCRPPPPRLWGTSQPRMSSGFWPHSACRSWKEGRERSVSTHRPSAPSPALLPAQISLKAFILGLPQRSASSSQAPNTNSKALKLRGKEHQPNRALVEEQEPILLGFLLAGSSIMG